MPELVLIRATGRLVSWYTDEREFEFERTDRLVYRGAIHPEVANRPAVIGGPRTATALIEDDGETFTLVGWAPEGKEPVAAPPPPPMEQELLGQDVTPRGMGGRE